MNDLAAREGSGTDEPSGRDTLTLTGISCKSISRYRNASAPTDLFGCVCISRGPEARAEKFALPELWTVELALDLAGWKPALLEGETDAFL